MNEQKKILIGYDGSECADAALDDLSRAGLPPDAEAQILSVAEVWLPPPPPSAYEIVEQAREVEVPADLKRVYARGSLAAKEARATSLNERVLALGRTFRTGKCPLILHVDRRRGNWCLELINGNPI